jgi:fluoride ion exporter CrcB/FEX
MTTQHFVDKTLEDRADERDTIARNRTMTKVAGGLVNFGLVVSAILTMVYLTLLTEESAGLIDPWGYILGGLVGLVAVIPAELGLVIWRERLAGERHISSQQRWTAVVAMLLAGIFSALTTSSFFSYSLPQLFPPSYLAIAPTLNVGAIVGAWIVFIMAVVFYSISSRDTQQNLASAAAFQAMFEARIAVLRSSAEAVRTGAENTITAMEQGGIFDRDARRLITGSLGIEQNRLDALPQQQPAQQPVNGRFHAHQDQQPTGTPSNGGRPFGLPGGETIDLVDLAERQAAERVGFVETDQATEGSRGILIFENGEWMTTWVGADAQSYARPVNLPEDVGQAWAYVNRRNLAPEGMTYGHFAELHKRGNFTRRGR